MGGWVGGLFTHLELMTHTVALHLSLPKVQALASVVHTDLWWVGGWVVEKIGRKRNRQ